MATIEGQRLTTFDVTADGRRVRLNFTDESDQPASISLPSECLGQLLMTLPSIVARALRAQFNDASQRLVFPAEEWRLEGSEDSRVILTIGTGGGFEASYAFERDHLRGIADGVQAGGKSDRDNRRLN